MYAQDNNGKLPFTCIQKLWHKMDLTNAKTEQQCDKKTERKK